MRRDLARYDGLLDILVERLLRELESEALNEKPAPPWQALARVEDGSSENDSTAERADESGARLPMPKV